MNSCLIRQPRLLCVLLAVICIPGGMAVAQTFSGSFRPFVTAITPVIGPNGVVGGIRIDVNGVVKRLEPDATGRLAELRLQSMGPVSDAARQPGALRKISLRRLEQALVQLSESDQKMTEEMKYLAGLQRIEYVFVDPENKDIILAGPAEGWRVNASGFVVGESSGRPVIDLCDLLLALRTGWNEAAGGVTCSMDATPEGMANYTGYMRGANRQFNEQTMREMSAAIGNYEVKFSGLPASSHYARTLIAADLMMKRLAMNLEPSPVRGLTSYVQMLQKSGRRVQTDTSPRWWLASRYKPVLRDEGGLAWNIRGPAVRAMTSEDILDREGQTVDSRQINRLAQRWANNFTQHYQELSLQLPVFGQLRNCMDLALVAALLHQYELFDAAGFHAEILRDAQRVPVAEYRVPKFTEPQISYARGTRGWIVTLSGGIDIDGWTFAANTRIDANLSTLHQQAVESAGESWWWD